MSSSLFFTQKKSGPALATVEDILSKAAKIACDDQFLINAGQALVAIPDAVFAVHTKGVEQFDDLVKALGLPAKNHPKAGL